MQAAGYRADCCDLVTPAPAPATYGEQGHPQQRTEYRPGNSAFSRACALSGAGLALGQVLAVIGALGAVVNQRLILRTCICASSQDGCRQDDGDFSWC